jgi:hypothetical protein
MAITIKLKQVVENDNGSYTVYVQGLRDDGKAITKTRDYDCVSAVELKALLKPLFENLVAQEKRKETIRGIAQGVLDEIILEVEQ